MALTIGKVSHLDANGRGFGFVKTGKDKFFFHQTSLSRWYDVAKGDVVAFKAGKNSRGLTACEVRPTGSDQYVSRVRMSCRTCSGSHHWSDCHRLSCKRRLSVRVHFDGETEGFEAEEEVKNMPVHFRRPQSSGCAMHSNQVMHATLADVSFHALRDHAVLDEQLWTRINKLDNPSGDPWRVRLEDKLMHFEPRLCPESWANEVDVRAGEGINGWVNKFVNPDVTQEQRAEISETIRLILANVLKYAAKEADIKKELKFSRSLETASRNALLMSKSDDSEHSEKLQRIPLKNVSVRYGNVCCEFCNGSEWRGVVDRVRQLIFPVLQNLESSNADCKLIADAVRSPHTVLLYHYAEKKEYFPNVMKDIGQLNKVKNRFGVVDNVMFPYFPFSGFAVNVDVDYNDDDDDGDGGGGGGGGASYK